MNKKLLNRYVISWVILLVMFNVLCFATPKELAGYAKFAGAFWASYALMTLAMIGQLVCALYALRQENARKLFYKLPVFTIGYGSMIAGFVIGAVCMAIPDLPNWAGVVCAVLLLGFTAIAVFKADAAAEIVADRDETIRAKTAAVKTLRAEAEVILGRCASEEIKAEAVKVRDALRYADPMSNAALAPIEGRIGDKLTQLSTQAEAGDLEAVRATVKAALELLEERATLCRAQK